MTAATESANLSRLVSRNAAWEQFRKSLRNYVGRGKRLSVKEASNGSGVPSRMIESYMAPVDGTDFRAPPLEDFLSLASFIGPEFTSEVLSLAAQAAFWLPDGEDLPPGDLAADNSDDNATIVRAAMDGVFDGEERPVLRKVGLRMVSRGAALASLAAA